MSLIRCSRYSYEGRPSRWTCLSTCTNHPAGRLTLCGRGRFSSILGRFGHKRAAKARCSRDHGRTENGLGTCPWIQRFDPRSSCLVKPAVLYCMYIHTVSRLPTSAALWGPGVGRTKPSLGIRSPLLNNMETRHKVMSFVLYVQYIHLPTNTNTQQMQLRAQTRIVYYHYPKPTG
jgi:hypothetical protein